MTEPARPLTEDELQILGYIQELHGEQNTSDKVFISAKDEAVLFVSDRAGERIFGAVLTNIARFAREDGLSHEEICEQYLLARAKAAPSTHEQPLIVHGLTPPPPA